MKPHINWNYSPYTPLDRQTRYYSPYITSLSPFETGCHFSFIDNGKPNSIHSAFVKKLDEETYKEYKLGNDVEFTFSCLNSETDYTFYIERDDGARSESRLFRTGKVYGTVVNYLHPDDKAYEFSGRYLCSPSLIKLPSGKLLSSMDVFEGKSPQNLTFIFSSKDNGKTWKYECELFPCFWGQMFYEESRLYMLSVSKEYGDLLIGYSDDEGKTWSNPTVLFRGANNLYEKGIHRAPMKVLKANGRLWTDIEYGAWGKKEFNNAILSAPIGEKDYTNPNVWTLSNFFMHNEQKLENEEDLKYYGGAGAIEGTCVQSKDGQIYDFLRYKNRVSLMLKLEDNNPEGNLVFSRFVEMPITSSKFDIVYDEISSSYYAICSSYDDEYKTVRNYLSLYKSPDLISWEKVCDLIDERKSDPNLVGFQYVSFIIDGDDILYLSRTAYNGAHTFHDTNYQTFHTIKNFRSK